MFVERPFFDVDVDWRALRARSEHEPSLLEIQGAINATAKILRVRSLPMWGDAGARGRTFFGGPRAIRRSSSPCSCSRVHRGQH